MLGKEYYRSRLKGRKAGHMTPFNRLIYLLYRPKEDFPDKLYSTFNH